MVRGIDDHDVALDCGAILLDILIAGVVAHELLDLLIYLGLGRVLRGHLDGGRVIGVELADRGHRDRDGSAQLLVLHNGRNVLTVVGTPDRHDVKLLEHLGLGHVDEVLRGLSEDRIATNDAVDNRARRTATAKALKVVLLGYVLVGHVDGLVDLVGRHGKICDHLIVLGPIGSDGDVQRSSSVSMQAMPAAPPSALRTCASWCGRKDSNLHGVTPTGT